MPELIFDNTIITDGGSTTVPTENGRLLIHNVRVFEAGTYFCRADNGVGSAIEKSIRVIISEPPKVIPFAFDKTLSEGQNTVVTCTIREGSKPVQLQWLKDGHEVVGGGVVKLIKHETILVLSIEPVKVAHSETTPAWLGTNMDTTDTRRRCE
ncbi:hypothetical protein MRX96_050870 [Rhipicephalus microplus]